MSGEEMQGWSRTIRLLPASTCHLV